MGTTGICKYCNGTGKVNMYDPVTGKHVNNLPCPCQNKMEMIKPPETKDLVKS